MKRVTVELTKKTHARLVERVRKNRKAGRYPASISTLVGQALRRYLTASDSPSPSP